MAVFVALLRAVNVGGAGKLPMSELRALCEAAGCANVTTYIQSGNVVFTSRLAGVRVKKNLEAALSKKMGKRVVVLVRTPADLDAIIKRNPFKHASPNRLLVLFLDHAAPRNALAGLRIPGREEVELSGREILHPLSERNGPFETENPARGCRDRTQSEHDQKAARSRSRSRGELVKLARTTFSILPRLLPVPRHAVAATWPQRGRVCR